MSKDNVKAIVITIHFSFIDAELFFFIVGSLEVY